MNVSHQEPLKVQSWSVPLELSVYEQRPELQELCKQISTQGWTGEGRWLAGLSETGRRNLRRSLEQLGLLNSLGKLTDDGLQCRDHQWAPSLEQGVYRLWWVEHPALEHPRLLHLELQRPDPYERDVAQLASAEPVERLLMRQHDLPTDASKRLKLHAFLSDKSNREATPLGRKELPKLTVNLHWQLDLLSGNNRRWLEGSFGKREQGAFPKPFRYDLPALPAEFVAGLLSSWTPNWDARQKRLKIPCDLKPFERTEDSFTRSETFPDVEIPGQCSLRSLTLAEMPVTPSSPLEAVRWVKALFLTRVVKSEGYLTQANINQHWRDVVNLPHLAEASTPPPSQAQLLPELKQQVPAYWRLATPLDLAWIPG